ncbi:hypothetical protein TNCV_3754571 [Trichonephila clavipes]|nr:hypothetical protein TNCV_3754571 [Trichonephila clavipes]
MHVESVQAQKSSLAKCGSLSMGLEHQKNKTKNASFTKGTIAQNSIRRLRSIPELRHNGSAVSNPAAAL